MTLQEFNMELKYKFTDLNAYKINISIIFSMRKLSVLMLWFREAEVLEKMIGRK